MKHDDDPILVSRSDQSGDPKLGDHASTSRVARALFDTSRTTSCGRFRVTIESFAVGPDLMLSQDAARSCKELSDILSEASALALQTAVRILDPEFFPADAQTIELVDARSQTPDDHP